MEDFASYLIAARARTGLTQSQLATAAGLTPSYLSFIENRKKPPPSDEVCRRLASVLKVPAAEMLEIAHLQRAPAPLRRKLESLKERLHRERRSMRHVVQALLSPFVPGLFVDPAGFDLPTAAESPARQRQLKEILGALGRRYADREREFRKLLDALRPRDRERLLKALPAILRGAEEIGGPEEPPPAPVLHYSPPDAPEGAPFLLLAAETVLGGEIRAGDRMLVDPGASPMPGDLLVLRGEEGPRYARLRLSGSDYLLETGGGQAMTGEVRLQAEELSRTLRATCAGVVLEIHRTLRRGEAPPSPEGRPAG